MSLIEGIGDEVTILASILIVMITLLIAWLSTFVSDRPNQRVVSVLSTGDTVPGDEIEQRRRSTSSIETTNLRLTQAGLNVAQASQSGQIAGTHLTSDTSAQEEHGIQELERTTHFLEDPGVSAVDQHNSTTSDVIDQPGEIGQCRPHEVNTSGQAFDAGTTTSTSRESNPPSSHGPAHDDREQTTEGSICIRIKYLSDREREVFADPSETLGEFRRRVFNSELESDQIVRLIFNGHLLTDDDSSLSSLNFADNCVIHCLYSRNAAPPSSNTDQDLREVDVDLGHFMIPLFTCILGFVWYLRWQYRYMFNATSTLSLVGVSTLFVLAVLASWRG